jgi:hypothetical protein
MNIQTNLVLFGKHPSCNEYLNIGRNSYFSKSISNWVQKGYEAFLQADNKKVSLTCKHFLMLNEQEDSFTCGSIKISHDLKNREYPLMVLLEIFPYSKFSSFVDVLNYCKNIWDKLSTMLDKPCSLSELRSELKNLVNIRFDKMKIFDSVCDEQSVQEDKLDNSCTISLSSKINFKNMYKNLPNKKELSVFADEQLNIMKFYYRSLTTHDFVTLVRL